MITTSGPINVELSSWNIVINLATEDEHFIGYDDNLATSRFSSPIIYFDEEVGVGITFSQTVYRTIGPPSPFRSETIYHLNKISEIRHMNYKIKYLIQSNIRFKSHFNRLYLRFPIIYRGRHEQRCTLNQEGIACGGGWFSLIAQLSNDIETIAKQMRADGYDDDELPKVLQVKEKFGGLRFYMANQTSEIRVLIEEAQRTSFLLCEVCGQPGNGFDDDGWRRTVCEECKRKEE